ncbi:sirohydrochlorin chelatase [Cohnella sp.]|uniref:sirohydrochlorin chelatase n=1 Tax=Cohnella sp. TaxID=1883426 RepID=UPI003568960B
MKPGLLVISHGSREAGWVALVDESIEAARAHLGSQLLIEAAFLELVEGRLIQDGIDRLEAAGVTHLFALPLFVSSGSTHVDEIGWALGAYPKSRTETELEPIRISAALTYGKPMDDDQEIVDVILDRMKKLSIHPAKESILLIGHGSKEEGFQEAWEQGFDSIGEQLLRLGGYNAYSSALLQLEEVPERWESLMSGHPMNEIIVVPLFLSEGYFTKQIIPRKLEGLRCRYNGCTLMPHPKIADWIVRKTLEWLKDLGIH